MKLAPISKLKVQIRGLFYEVRLLSDKDYDILHGKDSDAITISRSFLIDFRASTFTLTLVRHETLHAFLNSSLTEMADLSPIQTEECLCELFAHFGPIMLKTADKIYNTLNKNNKR